MSGVVRLAQADLPALLALQHLAFQSEAALYPGQPIAALTETLEELRQDCTARMVFGVFEDSRLIGSVRGFTREGVGHIERLMVHPEARGRGLARQLMAAIEGALDAPTYALFTGARSEGNLRLYAALGYTVTGSSERGGVPLVHLSRARSQEVPA